MHRLNQTQEERTGASQAVNQAKNSVEYERGWN